MIIYNITIKVDHAIASDWLRWLQAVHIPEVMATGCFKKYQLVRLMDLDETEGPGFAIQYYAEDYTSYQRYLIDYAEGLRQKSFDLWGNRFIAFRTVMEVIN